MSDFQNAMFIVVDRETRKVLDSSRLEYSWDVHTVVKNHDLSRDAFEACLPNVADEMTDRFYDAVDRARDEAKERWIEEHD